MQYSVSNLPFVGYELHRLKALKPEVGVEVFGEYGNEHYWKHYLPPILEGRTGGFSVHGPFCGLDLAQADCPFDEVIAAYRQSFALCAAHNAAFCVCHPCEIKPAYPASFSIRDGENRAIERVGELARIAHEEGVRLAVENLAHPRSMFDQTRYIEAFFDVPHLGYLIDIGHAVTRGWNLSALLARLGERILGFHAHDNDGENDTHALVGTGVVDWVRFLSEHAAYTPDAPLVLEYAKADLGDMDASIAFLNDCAKKARALKQ